MKWICLPLRMHGRLEEAEKMTRAGADIIVAHCGCTTGGTTGMEWAPSLDVAPDSYRMYACIKGNQSGCDRNVPWRPDFFSG